MTCDMQAKVIDGKSIAKQIREEVASEVARLKDATGVVPGLAVVLVGSRKDSQTYVRNKRKACGDVGIASYEVNLSDGCTEDEVIRHISDFNKDPSVHGILVQLPLPRVSFSFNLLATFLLGIFTENKSWVTNKDVYRQSFIDDRLNLFDCGERIYL